MASVTPPTALTASTDLNDNGLSSSSEASSSNDVEEDEDEVDEDEVDDDDDDDEEEDDDDDISLLATKMQHSSEPLEDLLSLGRGEQEYVLQEIIRRANLYDDMVRLAEEDASSMKHFFKPSRRLQDHFDHTLYVDVYDSDEDHGYSEVELAVSIEVFLNHRSDESDFRAFSTVDDGEMGKLIWITEDTFFWIVEDNNEVDFERLDRYVVQRATFTATSGATHDLVLANYKTYYNNSESLSVGALSVFWHVVTTSNCVKLELKSALRGSALLFETTSSQLLETSPSLELLEFEGFGFKESGCRALATLERTGLEVTFRDCSFDAQGVEDAFIEWLRHSQVVSKLECCSMQDCLFSALSGNSSVKSLSIGGLSSGFDDYLFPFLAEALRGNQGIEILSVSVNVSEKTCLIFRSLWAHPRIQSVSLRISFGVKTDMMNEVLKLVQSNTVVHTIDLPNHVKDEEFFQNSIVPRLEMNRNYFGDQRQALKRADPSIRDRLLGRALHVVRSNPNLLFRFLSDNIPAFARSDEDGPIITSGQKRKARP
jgi:hypothetical protein